MLHIRVGGSHSGGCAVGTQVLGTAQCGAVPSVMGRAGRDPHGTSAPAILGTLSPLCATHPGDTVTIETAADVGWEGWGMWQPPNPPGVRGTVPTAPPKNHIAALPMHPPCPPIGHPSLGRAASPQLHLGPSGMCPALVWGHWFRVPAVPGTALQGSQIPPGSFAAWGTDPKLEGLS